MLELKIWYGGSLLLLSPYFKIFAKIFPKILGEFRLVIYSRVAKISKINHLKGS